MVVEDTCPRVSAVNTLEHLQFPDDFPNHYPKKVHLARQLSSSSSRSISLLQALALSVSQVFSIYIPPSYNWSKMRMLLVFDLSIV